jgi:hypothetical protein
MAQLKKKKKKREGEIVVWSGKQRKFGEFVFERTKANEKRKKVGNLKRRNQVLVCGQRKGFGSGRTKNGKTKILKVVQ